VEVDRVVVVGVGGIGSNIAAPLCRYLQYSVKTPDLVTVVLVDGDEYEHKNKERQNCLDTDVAQNKAEVEAQKLSEMFTMVDIEACPRYVTPDNIDGIIKEGDVVFSGVDNHKTRNTIAKYADTLDNITVISGGNELTDGNVQVFVKRDGKKLTANLHEYHDEIANPKDKSPDELGCMDMVDTQPQLFFVNLTIGVLMLSAFHNLLNPQEGEEIHGEIYTDIVKQSTVPYVRRPLQNEA